jgi:hypothetical protein
MSLDISILVGKTLKDIQGAEGDKIVNFITDEDKVYRLYHEQDCCEVVRVYDINGDINDLIGSPILMAEESVNHPEIEDKEEIYANDSHTWTFYRFATVKGYVNIRWLGESNGYYSESVFFTEVV